MLVCSIVSPALIRSSSVIGKPSRHAGAGRLGDVVADAELRSRRPAVVDVEAGADAVDGEVRVGVRQADVAVDLAVLTLKVSDLPLPKMLACETERLHDQLVRRWRSRAPNSTAPVGFSFTFSVTSTWSVVPVTGSVSSSTLGFEVAEPVDALARVLELLSRRRTRPRAGAARGGRPRRASWCCRRR